MIVCFSFGYSISSETFKRAFMYLKLTSLDFGVISSYHYIHYFASLNYFKPITFVYFSHYQKRIKIITISQYSLIPFLCSNKYFTYTLITYNHLTACVFLNYRLKLIQKIIQHSNHERLKNYKWQQTS